MKKDEIKRKINRFFRRTKKIIKKIIADKQLLTIFLLMFLVIVIGCIVIGVLRTFIIIASLVLIAFIVRFIMKIKDDKEREKLEEDSSDSDLTFENELDDEEIPSNERRKKIIKEKEKETIEEKIESDKDVIMAKKKKKNKKEKEKEKLISKIVTIILILILIGILLGVAFIGYVVISAPDFNPGNLYRKESSIVYDKNGEVIAKLGAEQRKTITYDEMPEVLIDAIIATEDSRYFQHNGVDLPRFMKAVVGQLLRRSGAGGGSTITMQVSKNAYTSSAASGIKGIIRKFTDIYLSVFKLEKKYTKEQILEYYVNIPDLSSNSFGVAAAAENYFGKDVSELNLSEAALIAGLFQAPTAYNPYFYPDAAAERRAVVLRLMKRHGYITEDEERMANEISVESLLGVRSSTNPYQSFIDVVTTEISEKTGESPLQTPMKIYTTLDKAKQDHLNKVINGELFTWPNDTVQVGIAATDIETGGIVALSGGRNTVALGTNRAVGMRKQPGSAAKPIFDYGPGVEYNNWSTYTPFIDEKWGYTNGGQIKNWDGQFYGFLTLRRSLGLSRNVPALKAFQNNNNKNIYNFVTSLGIEPETEDGWVHEAHALGAFDGVSPLQMAAAYSAFGNGGYYIKPYTVTKIVYMDSNQTKEYKPSKVKVMSDATAYIITNSLVWAVDSGLSAGGRISGMQVAAKTGTSNFDAKTVEAYNIPDNATKDYWIVGYTPTVSLGLWYGYDKITDGYNVMADNSRKDTVFRTVLKGITEKEPTKFTVPKSVTAVGIENGTVPAMLPSDGTPSNMITTEYFKSGTEPTEVSPRYQKLSNPSGLSVTVDNKKATLTWKAANIPAYYTENWMESHIKAGMGDTRDSYLKYRKDEVEKLGSFGYDIYISYKGTEKYITTTTETSAVVDITNYSADDVKFIVKTAWANDKSTISSGSEYTIKKEDLSIVSVELKGSASITLNINDTYTDQSVIVLDNFVDVTANSIITYTITNSNNQMLSEVDTSTPGTYKINYKVVYNGSTYEKVRTIIVKEAEIPTNNEQNNEQNENGSN